IATAQPIFLSPWVFNGMANPLAAAQPQFTSLSSLSALGGTGVASTQQVSPSSQPAMTSSEQMMVTMMVMMMGMVMGALGDNASANVLKPMQAIMALLGGGSLIDTATTTTAATELAGKSDAQLRQTHSDLKAQLETMQKQLDEYPADLNVDTDPTRFLAATELADKASAATIKLRLVGNEIKKNAYKDHPQYETIAKYFDQDSAYAKQLDALRLKKLQNSKLVASLPAQDSKRTDAMLDGIDLRYEEKILVSKAQKNENGLLRLLLADHPQFDQLASVLDSQEASVDDVLAMHKKIRDNFKASAPGLVDDKTASSLLAENASLDYKVAKLGVEQSKASRDLTRSFYQGHPLEVVMGQTFDKLDELSEKKLGLKQMIRTLKLAQLNFDGANGLYLMLQQFSDQLEGRVANINKQASKLIDELGAQLGEDDLLFHPFGDAIPSAE
ncbi:MAG: hypothetical protein KC476_09355, partial [Cyanobacteria bacterium HKST-UBA06]|nr:hypothetical protein [Cyanobacteria bacterium HKST-UBA06]